ncbi:hypothetical protein QCA50_000016 [Cerrena zonata]|uniref:WD40 repeat-like protein n=1 Tax=Cerrena zonata TaxID=2478898 RepID=A0AAW0GRV4_9APHY
MSNVNGKDDDDTGPQRAPSPPPHTTFAARGVHAPTFSAFRPRDTRIVSTQAMNHVAWNCDGQRLAAVGIDKLVRVWSPEKSMELRSAQIYSGGHSDDVDYISWNPTHPDLFCTSSSRDKRIVFWDARQSRPVQVMAVRYIPVQTAYSPDARILTVFSNAKTMYCLRYGNQGEDLKEQWYQTDIPGFAASSAVFSPAGDALVVAMSSEASVRIISFPAHEVLHSMPAHLHGCTALALDPRGRYVATGGNDTIVNLFDTQEWVCVRTITACDNGITALSFSYDGEFIAIASTGSYIDICATETGLSLHRIPALGEGRTVQWHPSKHIIAYCGQTATRENGPPPAAWFSLFGPGM